MISHLKAVRLTIYHIQKKLHLQRFASQRCCTLAKRTYIILYFHINKILKLFFYLFII